MFCALENLFKNKDELLDNMTIEQFLGPQHINPIPKITDSQKKSMEGEIRIEELIQCIKKVK